MNGKKRILIVDDEILITKALDFLFSQHDYETETAHNVHEAKEKIEAQEFDLMLVDIIMPGESGLDFLNFIREKQPELPVIIMTGQPSFESAFKAVNSYATEYITKPLKNDKIIGLVNSLLRPTVK